MTITITGLPLQATVQDTTLIPVETASVTGHITASSIKTYISAATLSTITATTGTITNNLQTGSLNTGAIEATTIHAASGVTFDTTLSVSGASTFAADINNTVGNITTLANVNAGNINITSGSLKTTGNVSVGHILPAANVTYNIGNGGLWFSNLYASVAAFNSATINTGISFGTSGVANIGSSSSLASNIFTVTATVNGGGLQTLSTASNIGNLTASFGNTHSTTFIVGTGGIKTTSTAANIGSLISSFGNTHSTAVIVGTGGIQTTSTAANIGSLASSFGNIHSGTFIVGTGGVLPTANSTVNLGSSGAWFNNIYGTAIHAQYADLAEKYTSDSAYTPGTVVIFGDLTEVTISTEANDRRVAGVVSTDPAYLMNEGIDGVAVALQGRVPCQVTGTVLRGDLMVTSSIPGVAMTNNDPKMGTVIGKALGSHIGDGVGVIEVVVGRI